MWMHSSSIRFRVRSAREWTRSSSFSRIARLCARRARRVRRLRWSSTRCGGRVCPRVAGGGGRRLARDSGSSERLRRRSPICRRSCRVQLCRCRWHRWSSTRKWGVETRERKEGGGTNRHACQEKGRTGDVEEVRMHGVGRERSTRRSRQDKERGVRTGPRNTHPIRHLPCGPNALIGCSQYWLHQQFCESRKSMNLVGPSPYM